MSVTRINEWQDRQLLEWIKKELKRSGSDEDDEGHPYRVVLFAAANVGANPRRLAEVTGYSRDLIDKIDNRMRAAGIWIGEDADVNDLEASYCRFGLHSLVAQGKLLVIPGSMPRVYALADHLQPTGRVLRCMDADAIS